MNLINKINEYLEYSNLFKREGTYQYDKATARHMSKCLYTLNITDYTDLNSLSIQSMVKYFKSSTGFKNSKINSVIAFLYKVLNHYSIKTELPKRYKLPKDTVHFKSLGDDDLKTLLNYLENNESKYNLAIYMLLESGIRFNELAHIEYENIDFNTQCILLNHTKNGIKRVARYGHYSKSYIDGIEHDYFTNITYSGLRHYFDKIKKNTSINVLHPHMLRKTFATRLLKKGCPLTSIQKYLGHNDIKMTMVYLDIDIQMLDSDYNNYYPY